MTEIRNLEPDDFRHLLIIETESFENGYSPYFIKMIPILFGNTSYIAVKGRRPLGYIAGAIEQSNRHRAWIISLAIRPRMRKQGLGNRLLQTGLDNFTRKGLREVKLTVSPANATAIHLYENHGFSICKEAKNYYGPGQNRLLMKIVLAGKK